MALGTEMGLDPGHIVLDGDPAAPPPPKSGAPHYFRPISVVTMDQDATWYRVRLENVHSRPENWEVLEAK